MLEWLKKKREKSEKRFGEKIKTATFALRFKKRKFFDKRLRFSQIRENKFQNYLVRNKKFLTFATPKRIAEGEVKKEKEIINKDL